MQNSFKHTCTVTQPASLLGDKYVINRAISSTNSGILHCLVDISFPESEVRSTALIPISCWTPNQEPSLSCL